MAGRAGRRGIDKIGNVVHCNNLFSLLIYSVFSASAIGEIIEDPLINFPICSPPQNIFTFSFKLTY